MLIKKKQKKKQQKKKQQTNKKKTQDNSNCQQSLWHLLYVYTSEANLTVQSEPNLGKYVESFRLV